MPSSVADCLRLTSTPKPGTADPNFFGPYIKAPQATDVNPMGRWLYGLSFFNIFQLFFAEDSGNVAVPAS
jgi:hypothetical protein